MKTLLLDTRLWDLFADAAGNIAAATAPYQLAQDVASAIRVFAGEVWYDTSKGVPYKQQILGHAPPVQYFREQMVRAALTVPGVVAAECVIESFEDRKVTGAVTFTAIDGTTGTVSL